MTPTAPDLAKISGRWVGRAEPALEIHWTSGFSGHAPPLRVDVETVNADGMLTLIVIGENWVRLFLHAQRSPQQGIYAGQQQAGPESLLVPHPPGQ